jgi:hypothetical protein
MIITQHLFQLFNSSMIYSSATNYYADQQNSWWRHISGPTNIPGLLKSSQVEDWFDLPYFHIPLVQTANNGKKMCHIATHPLFTFRSSNTKVYETNLVPTPSIELALIVQSHSMAPAPRYLCRCDPNQRACMLSQLRYILLSQLCTLPK